MSDNKRYCVKCGEVLDEGFDFDEQGHLYICSNKECFFFRIFQAGFGLHEGIPNGS